jgi:FAD synthase
MIQDTIKIKIDKHYGVEHIYAIDYKKELATLTGQVTLTREKIQALKDMGFKFKIIHNSEV